MLKPPGMTSFDVVAYLRRLTKIKRIGHTGTLDPGAAGVLPICMGVATKAIEYLVEKDKTYRCELTLGTETDTQDAFGTVTARNCVQADEQRIADAMSSFIGSYGQLPPMHSAVRVGGKKLYELARDGLTVEREPRAVTIHSIKIIKFSTANGGAVKVLFDVSCSKGTYIRTLCHDIGRRLGCGGYMSFLLRTAAGPFVIGDALTVEEIGSLVSDGRLGEKLLGVDKAFENYGAIVLDNEKERKIINGVAVELYPVRNGHTENARLVRLYNKDGSFVALGGITVSGGKSYLKSKKLFLTGA